MQMRIHHTLRHADVGKGRVDALQLPDKLGVFVGVFVVVFVVGVVVVPCVKMVVLVVLDRNSTSAAREDSTLSAPYVCITLALRCQFL